jgi:triacylglycerol lipase
VSATNCFRERFSAGATGHDSVNAYLLMVVNRLLFPDQVKAVTSDKADFRRKFRAHFEPLGIDEFNFIHGSPGDRHGTEAVVMSNDRIVVVAFRGTQFTATWSQFIADFVATDLDVAMVPVPEFGNGAKVHRGFRAAFLQERDRVLDAVRTQRTAGQRIWVTGHSLGGALAILAARTIRAQGMQVRGLYTYGCPRAVNESFRSAIGISNVQRYVYALDLVPMVPDDVALGYRHVGRTNNFEVPFLPGAGPYDSVLKLDRAEVRGVGNVFDHDLARYEAALFHQLNADQQDVVPKPVLPG